jgi:hypothetical protein
MTTPTQRTMKLLKEEYDLVEVVERWIPNPKHPGGGFRKDLYGFIDILCVDEHGITAVQSCGASYSAHMRTITEECRGQVLKWLKVAGLALYAWRKVKKKRGGKAMVWKPRIAHFSLINGKILVQEEKRSFTV